MVNCHLHNAIFNSVDEGILVLDATTGEIIDCNEICEKYFNCDKDNVKAKKIFDLTNEFNDIKKWNSFVNEIKVKDCISTDIILTPQISTSSKLVIYKNLFVNAPGMDYLVVFIKETQSQKKINKIEDELLIFKTLAQTAGYGLGVATIQGKIVYVNEYMATVHGYSVDELKELQFYSLLADYELENLEKIDKELFKNGTTKPFYIDHKKKDGTIFPMLMNISLINDESGKPAYFTAAAMDVSERKKQQQELTIKDWALESSSNAFALADMDGKITYVNPALVEIFGYDNKEEILGKTPLDFWYNKENASKALEKIQKHERWAGEFQGVKKHGQSFYLEWSASLVKDEHGNPIKMVATMNDISERIDNQRELIVRDYAIESAINAFVMSDFNGNIEFVNNAFLKMFGCKNKKDVIGKHVSEFWASPEMAKAIIEKGVKEGSWIGEFTGKKRTGENFYCRANGSVVFDPEKNPIGLVATIVDITDIKKAYEELLIKDKAIKSSINGIAFAGLDNCITYVNDSFLDMWGYEKSAEVLGRLTSEFWVAEEKAENVVHELFETGNWVGEMIAEKKHGEEFYVQVSANLIRDDNDAPFALMASFLDITEQKQWREQLIMQDKAINASINAIAFANLNNEITSVNDSFLKMWNCNNIDMVLGRKTDEFWSSEEQAKEVYETLMKRGSWIGEMKAVTTDGIHFEVQVSATMVTDEIGIPLTLMASFVDITEQKRAKDKLKESEERFRSVFESSGDCILVWDKDYNYLYANQAAIDHVGTTRDKVIGKNMRQGLGHVPEFMNLWMKRVDQAFEIGDAFRVEDKTFIGNNKIYSESSVSPIRNADGEIFAVSVVYRDITDRKQDEETILKFKTVIDNANFPVALSDMKGEIVYVNENAYRTTGYSKNELIGKKLSVFAAEGQESVIAEVFDRMQKQDKVGPVEVWHKKKEGTSFPVLANAFIIKDLEGTPSFIAHTGLDITDLKEAQKRILRFKTIIDNANFGIGIAGLNGRVMYMNNTFCNYLDYESSEVVGRDIKDFYPEITHEQMKSFLDDLYKNGTAGPIELMHIRKDGSKFPAFMNGVLGTDTMGKPSFIATSCIDITDLKEAQKQRERLIKDLNIKNEELEQAYEKLQTTYEELETTNEELETSYEEVQQSNEELNNTQHELAVTNIELEKALFKSKEANRLKSEFLAVMSHELRTPLSSMLGFSELLLASEDISDEDKENAEFVYESGYRLLKILGDLLELSVIEAGKFKIEYSELSVSNMLKDIYILLKDKITGGSNEFKYKINCRDIINSDPIRLRQILFNLVGNSSKFTSNGQITVIVDEDDSDYLFKVSDTGIGIKDDDKEIIFEMFKQVESGNRRSYQGTGLGLAICKKLVDAFHGSITVKSELNKGSVFTVTIPKEVR